MVSNTHIEPGVLGKTERELRTAFLHQVSNIPGGEKINKCIQCGTCSGSCPVSYSMDIQPREIVALFRAGDIESILKSRTIWICASCYACTIRCPCGIKVTDILYALKRMAIDNKMFSKKFPIYALSNSFVDVVNRYGRNHEPILILLYYLKTNPLKLLNMFSYAFKLWIRGRIRILPRRIKERKNFSAILAEAEIMELIVPVD